MTDLELAWAAGFFDGEGTTFASHRDLMVECPQASLDGTMPEVLIRLLGAVEVGRIGGPYYQSANRRPRFQWYARNQDAMLALGRLWPFLGEVKRAQATAASTRTGYGAVAGQLELSLVLA